MLKVKEVIIVEGKYDKIKLSSIVDGLIIETGGFQIFKDKEKRDLIRMLAQKHGVLILTDSDSAGFMIRNYLKGIVPADQIHHAYIPQILGKEKRKTVPSKEGFLGVEGMTEQILAEILNASGSVIFDEKTGKSITKADLYEAGLSGWSNSAEKRKMFLKKLGLPSQQSSEAFLDILNFTMTREKFLVLCENFEITRKVL